MSRAKKQKKRQWLAARDDMSIPIPPVCLDRLKHRCFQDQLDLLRELKESYPGFTLLGGGTDWLAHVDQGASILAVCHTDTVQKPTHFARVQDTNFDWVFCETFDDRLGVYTILDQLPSMGIKMDLLFTTNEERGKSTADLLKETVRPYNWIVEFDRRGDDVVFYEYDSPALHAAIKEVGFLKGAGSFTDICSLEHLKVSAFNVGMGHQDEHGSMARLHLPTYIQQLRLFHKFWQKNKDTAFPHVPPQRVRYDRQSAHWLDGWNDAWAYGASDIPSVRGAWSYPDTAKPIVSPGAWVTAQVTAEVRCALCLKTAKELGVQIFRLKGGTPMCLSCYQQYCAKESPSLRVDRLQQEDDPIPGVLSCPRCQDEWEDDPDNTCWLSETEFQCSNCGTVIDAVDGTVLELGDWDETGDDGGKALALSVSQMEKLENSTPV